MRFLRTFNVVGVHAAGEVGDVVVGGVLDVAGKTMYDKMLHFLTKDDQIRQLLLNEPRGRSAKCANLILPPCDPRADAGFLTMECEEYAAMSGSNTICTTTVLLETGMIKMQEPTTKITLDTVAGLVTATADCQDGKCQSVEVHNVPSFVVALDFEVEVPGLGKVLCDIAWGGMMYAIVDIACTGLSHDSVHGKKLVEYGELIKRAVQAKIHPAHPENPGIHGVTNFMFTVPHQDCPTGKLARNTVVVSPGRLDRSPCGTGCSARMAVMHARGQLAVGEKVRHVSIIGTEFEGGVLGTTKVGDYDAILPSIKGSAWISSFQQVVLDPQDPFPNGFRVGDAWETPA
ncbi:hypothetical protein PFICI_00871 [Pestalotiopsis fici W106-1]|uniref:Proline racemase n=1 Tax=Pestalotiopsis fici (strain W106-1 / CGMCC3.15140) TaxID=1229662 RepID=W3XLV1_PESFW|nr:uncharacterized protein PFICI_00871 [Pestalotiopsis fici W106-1]ETS87043.1 hypothetical protein PFICI_00871 [Pestalotiopsis fici W106-1]